jgi:hypothetical protein
MGLDWNPANKPLPGHEAEYWRLFADLSDQGSKDRESKEKRFHEISISAFETLRAPRVGMDAIADAWARRRHSDQKVVEPLEEWLAKLRGLYVVPLVDPCDGVPRYSNGEVAGYVEPFSFRAQFLKDCAYIIGDDLLEEAYENMKPDRLQEFGEALYHSATSYAAEHGIDLEAVHQTEDPDSPEFHLDVILAASRWCLFWASRGHPLEAYW